MIAKKTVDTEERKERTSQIPPPNYQGDFILHPAQIYGHEKHMHHYPQFLNLLFNMYHYKNREILDVTRIKKYSG